MITEVKVFENYTKNVKKYIDNSNYKTKYFVNLLKLSSATFYRKLKDHSFTVNEFIKLSEVLFPKEFYEYQLKEDIKQGLDDYENGRVIDARKMIEEERNKLNQLI